MKHRLMEDRSKNNLYRLCVEAETGFQDFDGLLGSVAVEPRPLNWRLSWFLSTLVEQKPERYSYLVPNIWKGLKDIRDHSVQRDLWHMLMHLDIPAETASDVFDKGVQVVVSEKYSVAERANAISVLKNVTHSFPELKQEALLVLQPLCSHSMASIRARGKMAVKALERLV